MPELLSSRLRRRLVQGEVLFQQGQRGEAAFVIESGTIEIYSERDGDRHVIARLGAHDIFGEMALLGDAVRTASAAAAEDTSLLIVTPEHLNERLMAADPMTRHLLRTVVSRCREMLGWSRAGAPEPTAFGAVEEEQHHDRELAFGRLKIEQELENALENREFKLFFQPIIRLSDGAVAGYEALIRWFKPGYGMIPPGEFIPVAEQSPLINRLGHWILTQAFEDLLRLEAAAGRGIFLTVNLSARQLGDPELVPILQRLVANPTAHGSLIKLEITESLMIGNVAQVQAFIAQCRELGLEIVLDDFGTGYCSLSYLHLFAVHTMKLDRSFVRGMAVSPASEVVVRNVVNMAHDLRLAVVVEGVETADEAALSKRLGIDYAQGYYFGRPAALDTILPRLATS